MNVFYIAFLPPPLAQGEYDFDALNFEQLILIGQSKSEMVVWMSLLIYCLDTIHTVKMKFLICNQ